MDLLDLWRDNDRLSWRKLDVLVRQLPPESATATILRLRADEAGVEPTTEPDPEAEQWSRAEQLLASVRDELHTLRWLYTSAHAEKGKGPRWKPDPLPRPGVAPRKRKVVLRPEQQSVLARHLALTQGGDQGGNVIYN